MTFVTKSASMAALTAIMILVPGLARAQEQPRIRVSFAPAVATVSGDAELALGGTFGYRFSEHFWFEGDFTWIDAAAGGFRDRALTSMGVTSGRHDRPRRPPRRSGMFGRRTGGGIGFPECRTS
jgi:hypothetical protein